MREIDEWMAELAALPLHGSDPDPTDEGLDRLWAAVLNEGTTSGARLTIDAPRSMERHATCACAPA